MNEALRAAWASGALDGSKTREKPDARSLSKTTKKKKDVRTCLEISELGLGTCMSCECVRFAAVLVGRGVGGERGDGGRGDALAQAPDEGCGHERRRVGRAVSGGD